MNKLTKKVIIVFFILLALVIIVFAADYYRINSGDGQLIDEHNQCRIVSNGGSNDIFVPTKTSQEWEDFRNNAPGSISFSSCIQDPCGGCGGNEICCDGTCIPDTYECQ